MKTFVLHILNFTSCKLHFELYILKCCDVEMSENIYLGDIWKAMKSKEQYTSKSIN